MSFHAHWPLCNSLVRHSFGKLVMSFHERACLHSRRLIHVTGTPLMLTFAVWGQQKVYLCKDNCRSCIHNALQAGVKLTRDSLSVKSH